MSPWLLALCVGQAAAPLDAGFAWNVPEQQDVIELHGKLEVQGLPIGVRAVRSKWNAERLVQHFVDQFEQAGLFIPPPSGQPHFLKEPQLTAYDPGRGRTYTVIFQPNPDGTTTLFLGEADVSARLKRGEATRLPVMPGATRLLSSNLEGARSLSFVVEQPQAQVDAYYREVLGKAGYQELQPRRFRRGERELTVTLSQEASAVRVHLWESSAPAAATP